MWKTISYFNNDDKYVNYSVNSMDLFNEERKARRFTRCSFINTFIFMASSVAKSAKRLKKIVDCKHIDKFLREN